MKKIKTFSEFVNENYKSEKTPNGIKVTDDNGKVIQISKNGIKELKTLLKKDSFKDTIERGSVNVEYDGNTLKLSSDDGTLVKLTGDQINF